MATTRVNDQDAICRYDTTVSLQGHILAAVFVMALSPVNELGERWAFTAMQ